MVRTLSVKPQWSATKLTLLRIQFCNALFLTNEQVKGTKICRTVKLMAAELRKNSSTVMAEKRRLFIELEAKTTIGWLADLQKA